MFSMRLLTLAALASMAYGHSQILAAQGLPGTPTSVGFLVDDLARNCTSISPCQQDAVIIRDAEITSNAVNECGRTEIAGNIDVGENTENALAAGQITQVKAGTQMTVTIHQVNADGAGPYTCDMDPTGNSLGVTGQTPLTVTNNVPGANGFSQAKTQDFNITVTMPATMNCTGGSTGNICTVRCRNNALAGPFGGCFPVQQADTNVKTNVASQITTAQTLQNIQAQIQQNQKDLPVAVAANQVDGTPEQLAAAKKVQDSVVPSVAVKASPVQTGAADAALQQGNAAGAAAGNANAGTGNANANAGNANAGTGKKGAKGAAAGAGNANAAAGAAKGNGNAAAGAGNAAAGAAKGNANAAAGAGNANAATGAGAAKGNANAATGAGNAAAGAGAAKGAAAAAGAAKGNANAAAGAAGAANNAKAGAANN